MTQYIGSGPAFSRVSAVQTPKTVRTRTEAEAAPAQSAQGLEVFADIRKLAAETAEKDQLSIRESVQNRTFRPNLTVTAERMLLDLGFGE